MNQLGTKDLGTYYVRVELADGRGFLHEWTTGARYTMGRYGSNPLTAERIEPTWASEADLFSTIVYAFTEGNFACWANLEDFLADAQQAPRRERDDHVCDGPTHVAKLTAIRPDGTEQLLYDEATEPQ